jgi:hypothetical protein
MEQGNTLSKKMFERLRDHLHAMRDEAIERNDREAAGDAERADALLYQFVGALDVDSWPNSNRETTDRIAPAT